MKLKEIIIVALPPLVLAFLLGLIYLLPMDTELQESAISEKLPYGTEMDGWYGKKTQATKEERGTLAADTIFSKGVYQRCSITGLGAEHACYGPPISVSIVYSGSDMNSSIHRPERCLPAQGHLNLMGRDVKVKLNNGREITFKRLQSFTLVGNQPNQRLEHINYYAFIGHDRICHSHIMRTLYDIWDRIAKGRTQRWAYLQVGGYWGEKTGITEAAAEAAILDLIADLVPRQINWQAIKD